MNPWSRHADVLVYDDDLGHYVGVFEDGACFRWPARRGGWLARQAVPPPRPEDGFYELPAMQARLALAASGFEP